MTESDREYVYECSSVLKNVTNVYTQNNYFNKCTDAINMRCGHYKEQFQKKEMSDRESVTNYVCVPNYVSDIRIESIFVIFPREKMS